MKNPLVLIAIGLVCLAIGAVMRFSGGPPQAVAGLVARCEQSLKERGPEAAELLPQCRDVAFANAMTATDAQSAARSISAANSREVGGGALSMFLLGLGAALTLAGVVVRLTKNRATTAT